MSSSESDALKPPTQNPAADRVARVIVLLYGVLADARPFWLYAAVKPSQYDKFIAGQKDGTLDLTRFSDYGELIISGEGTAPPDDVTVKVAQLYQTDPKSFFQPMDVEQEVAKKLSDSNASA